MLRKHKLIDKDSFMGFIRNPTDHYEKLSQSCLPDFDVESYLTLPSMPGDVVPQDLR